MYPTLFTLDLFSSSIRIASYGFFLVLAGLTVFFGSYWYAKKRKLPHKKVFIILLILVASTIIGSRILHILTHLSLYQAEPEKIFSTQYTGFSLYGGLLLSILSGVISSKLLTVNPWKLADAIAPFLGLGIAIMRVGCFLNGCCFGKKTDLPWGATFPHLGRSHLRQIVSDPLGLGVNSPVHPTQLYELLAALIGSAIAWYCIKKEYPAGVAILSFGLWYTTFRWFNYYLLDIPSSFEASAYLYPALYFLLIIICIFLLIKRSDKKVHSTKQ